MKLSERVAVVTGAASGIGRGSALALAREGARVVVSDIDERGGEATVRQIEQSAGEARFVRADVRDWAEMRSLMDGVVRRYGRLDILHANAGVDIRAPLHQMDEAEIDRQLDINLKGIIVSARHAVPHMLAAGQGVLVLTSSVQGLVGIETCSVYAACKAGIIGFTRTLSVELARKNIRVNCICPGSIQTPMLDRAVQGLDPADAEAAMESIRRGVPLGRVDTVEDVAAAVVYLASDDSAYITGTALIIDGGLVAYQPQ